jgi:hypothetical protein
MNLSLEAGEGARGPRKIIRLQREQVFNNLSAHETLPAPAAFDMCAENSLTTICFQRMVVYDKS